MALASALLVLTLIWVVIYALNYLLKTSATHSLLPSITASRHASQRNPWSDFTTTVLLKGPHLRVQTTALNLYHDLLASSFKSDLGAAPSRALTLLYDLGSVISLIGMLAALGFLFTTGGLSIVSLARRLWDFAHTNPATSDTFGALAKRSDVNSVSLGSSSSNSFIKPIIPGVTVPFAHLPIILFAVFLSQVIHELGHAIAGAIESLPLLSVGVSFTLVVPSAFVTFSNAAMDNLAPRARARVIAAGPFHNILLWCLLVSIGHTHLGSVFWSIGYRDISALGRVVTNVDSQSPLYGYLPTGSMIITLDDTPLGSHNASYDGWSLYLRERRHEQPLGWCATLPESYDTCCSGTKTPGHSCFVSLDSPTTRGCLDPIPILSHPNAAKRCTTDDQCSTTSQCIKPDAREQLLRLTVRRPPRDDLSEVILWSGPAEEIWEEVRVGTLAPRMFLLPAWLPYSAELFWEYLLMATLSLFFFNLLPLPYLDGSQFINTILEASLEDSDTYPDEYELEAFESQQDRRRSRRRSWWRGALRKLIPDLTLGLLGICVLLGILNVIKL